MMPLDLAAIFPFHLLLDDSLRIAGMGPSVSRLSALFKIDAALADVLEPIAPVASLDKKSIERNLRSTFLCEIRGSAIRLRGQMIFCGNPARLAFLCSPLFNHPDELSQFDLTATDFSPYESAIEYVYLMHARSQQLDELRQLNDHLQTTLGETQRLIEAEAALTRDLEVAADLRIHVASGRVVSISINSGQLTLLRGQVWRDQPLDDAPDWLQNLASPKDGNQTPGVAAVQVSIGAGRDQRSVDLRVSRVSQDEVIILGRDMTLENQEHMLLLQTLQNAMEAVLMVDDHDRITFFNNAAEEQFLYSREEVLGKHIDLLSLRAPPTAGEVRNQGWLHLAKGHNQRGELELVRKDQSRVLCSYSVSRVNVGSTSVVAAFLQDVTAQRLAQRRIQHQANHDGLTGLPNRTSFLRSLQRALRNNKCTGLAVALIDIDNFKTVNDLLGHGAGDHYLKSAADRIAEALRESDVACRLGGDEFAVILQTIGSAEDGQLAMSKVLDALGRPLTIDDVQWSPTASVGVAIADNSSTAPDLLRNADLAMYEAKAHGKGRVHCYTPNLTHRALRRIETQKKLEVGLKAGDIHAHFQPVVDIVSGKPKAFEALARWYPKVGSPIPPIEFIPIAENSDLITQIEEEIIDQALVAVKQIRASYSELSDLTVNVNISPRHFAKANFINCIEQVLVRHDLDAAALTLELTESILLNDTIKTQQQFRDLRSLGIGIALDDFGTGYSSLSYLEKYEFDLMKIDQSFVRGLSTQAIRRQLTEIIIRIAQVMDIDVVAEGIETAEEKRLLHSMECQYGQGYFYAKPMPAGEIDLFLKRHQWHRESSVPLMSIDGNPR